MVLSRRLHGFTSLTADSQLSSAICGVGQQAGLSPDALKGVFKRPAAQPSSQQLLSKPRPAMSAEKSVPVAKQALPASSDALQSERASCGRSRPSSSSELWDAKFFSHMRPLNVLPSQGSSINGMCLDYVGDIPAQICTLESGLLKAMSLLDGSQVGRHLTLRTITMSCQFQCSSAHACRSKQHF